MSHVKITFIWVISMFSLSLNLWEMKKQNAEVTLGQTRNELFLNQIELTDLWRAIWIPRPLCFCTFQAKKMARFHSRLRRAMKLGGWNTCCLSTVCFFLVSIKETRFWWRIIWRFWSSIDLFNAKVWGAKSKTAMSSHARLIRKFCTKAEHLPKWLLQLTMVTKLLFCIIFSWFNRIIF